MVLQGLVESSSLIRIIGQIFAKPTDSHKGWLIVLIYKKEKWQNIEIRGFSRTATICNLFYEISQTLLDRLVQNVVCMFMDPEWWVLDFGDHLDFL